MTLKGVIVGLIVGLMLGATGIAVAAGGYWTNKGTGYSCEGYSGAVVCKQTGYGTKYAVMINSKGQLIAFVGKETPLFTCKRGYGPASCTDVR